MKDENITQIDIMNDTVLYSFFQDWGIQILFAVAVWYIIEKLKTIDRNGIRRDNVARLTEMKVDAIAHALQSSPEPMGSHFNEQYNRKLADRMKEDNYIDTYGKP